MAEQAAEEKVEKSGGGLMGKLMIVGFMALVVGVECALAYILIPDADTITKDIEGRIQQSMPSTIAEGAESATEEEASDAAEVNLEDFSITVVQPNANTTLRVDFSLGGTVLEDKLPTFEELFAKKRSRFRYQVISEIRNSRREDLAEPELGLLCRKILEKSNDLFGEPLLQSVIFTDISQIEQ